MILYGGPKLPLNTYLLVPFHKTLELFLSRNMIPLSARISFRVCPNLHLV